MKKILLSVLIMMGTAAAFAQVPGTLSYQGILVKTSPPADAGKPVDDGVHFVRFRFFNVPTGGTAVYSSTGTGSGNSVTTYKGMFSFIIGSGSAGNDPIPAGIFNEQLYVEIEADGVTLTPRIPLTTTPYTFRAQTANSATALTTTLGIAGGGTGATTAAAARTNLGLGSLSTLSSVGSSEITDGSVATVDLADNSVTSAKIVDGTVATTDLADNSVTAAKISDGTIANADINAAAAIAVTKLAAGTNGQVLTTSGGVPTWTTPSAGGTVTNVATGTGLTGGPITTTGTISIATGGVTTTLLADNSVTSAKIVDATVATADLADGAISTVKLADNSVTSAKIVDATITTTDLADALITTAKLGDNSVTSAKIVDGTIATADIADGAITAAKLAAGSTLSGSGAANRVAFWSGTSALSSSSTLTWSGTNFGIGPATASNFLHIAADVTGASVATMEGHSTTSSRGPGITFLRSKGSVATPSAVADGDYLGGIGAMGRTASAYNISSGIQFEVDGTVSGTSVPGRIVFSTTTTGFSSTSEKMRLTNSGRLGIGTNAPASFLDVATDGNQWNLSSTEGDFKIGSTTHRIKMGIATSGGGAGDAYIGSQGGTNRLFLGAGTTLAQFQTMTLTGGSVGIGTTAPGALLDVNGTAVFRGFTGINTTTSIGASVFVASGTATAGNYTGMYLNGSDAASFPFYGYATAGVARMWHYYNGSTGNWVLWNGGDRMFVTNTGNVGIGAAPTFRLDVTNTTTPGRFYNSTNGTASDVLYLRGGSNTSSGSWFILFQRNDGTSIGTISQASATSVAYNTTSDLRLKNILRESNKGLSDLMKIKVYDYYYKDDKEKNVRMGFIAQQIVDVYPQAVTPPQPDKNNDPKENPWVMDYGNVTPLLVKAVQDQQQLINAQNETINGLKAELAELRKMVMAQQPKEGTTTTASVGKE